MDNSIRGLSRRDFLKLSGLGLLGLFLPARPISHLASPLAGAPVDAFTQGRICSTFLWAYDLPTIKGKRVKLYWRDLVVDIVGSAIDENAEDYNRVWYGLPDGSYLYSGWVQPVRTILNPTLTNFPKEGLLAEVSVPFTDAYESADPSSRVQHRLYFESTHWVVGSAPGPDGSAWYRLLDDKYDEYYFVSAAHLCFIPPEEIAPLSPNVAPKDKHIEVRLDSQLVLAYEGTRLVFAASAATGGNLRSCKYYTPDGIFSTYLKRPSRHMAAGDLTASGFDLPGVPWVMYLTEGGISLHGTYWHNDFGHPRSHGCVNLPPSAAKWLFRWTTPSVSPDKQFGIDSSKATRVVIAN